MILLVCHVFLMRSTSGSIPPLAELFFSLPFQISYRIVKAFIFNKNEGNNQKVENKVSGRVRVGAERALYCTNKAASI